MKLTFLGGLFLFVLSLAFSNVQGGAPPYKTPEAVFAAAMKATEKEDMKGFCNCLTEDSRDLMAGTMVFVGVMVKAFAAFGKDDVKDKIKVIDEALKNHGLTEEVLAKLKDGPLDPKNPDAMKKALHKMVEPVRDRPAFVADMFKALKQLDPGKKGATFLLKDGELKNVKIENGTAKGFVVSPGKREPIQFRRIGESWLIELPMDSFASPLQPKKVGG